jgi:hypothetical protein
MAALIRAIQLLNSGQDNDHSKALHRRFHGPTTEVLTPSTKAGFIAMGICGLLSFTSTLGLLLFLMHRFINWKRYYKRPLLHNQYVVLIFNLLLADIQQATAFLMCLHWVNKGAVSYPSAACVLQGWWIQVAEGDSCRITRLCFASLPCGRLSLRWASFPLRCIGPRRLSFPKLAGYVTLN